MSGKAKTGFKVRCLWTCVDVCAYEHRLRGYVCVDMAFDGEPVPVCICVKMPACRHGNLCPCMEVYTQCSYMSTGHVYLCMHMCSHVCTQELMCTEHACIHVCTYAHALNMCACSHVPVHTCSFPKADLTSCSPTFCPLLGLLTQHTCQCRAEWVMAS